MSESYFTLKSLAGPKQANLRDTLQRMAELLATSPEEGRFCVHIVESGPSQEESSWTLKLSKGTCKVGELSEAEADFEMITSPDTWRELTGGSLAPLRAFVDGRMRLRGDVEFGTRVLQHLRERED